MKGYEKHFWFFKATIRPRNALKKPVNIEYLQSSSKGHLFKKSKPGHYEGNEARRQTEISHQIINPGNDRKNLYSCSAKNYQQTEQSSVAHRVGIC